MDLDSHYWFNIVVIILLIAATAFFVATEFAIIKIRESRIQQLINEGSRSAEKAKQILDNLDGYLSACQLGITLTALALGWLGEPTVSGIVTPILYSIGFGNQAVTAFSFLIGFSVISFLHVVVGELAPKSLAIQRAEEVTLFAARPLIWFYKVMYPAIWVLNGSANALVSWFGLHNISETYGIHSEEEIRMLMVQSHEGGEINQTELDLTNNIFAMNEKVAVDIMIPRTDMVCLYTDIPVEENLQIISEEQFGRYPVCVEDKDNVIAYIHSKDLLGLLLKKAEITNLTQIYREPLFVYEFTPAVEVLERMQKQRKQLAIVLDEYGGTAGIVTLEDVLEEIVGDIEDEYDVADIPSIIVIEEGHYSVDARESILDVEELLTVNLEADSVHTLGGWFISHYSGKLKKGVHLIHEGYKFTIAEIAGNSIQRFDIQKEVELLEEEDNLPVVPS